jgi:hypothetical protein
MLAVRTPEAPLATRTLSRPAIRPSPLRDRVGYSDHDRFRGYFPVHFIPAYNLPVYASQCPSRDTTQDSLRGCSLGFTAAAISGDRVQRTCTAQPPQTRTSAIHASGSSRESFVPAGVSTPSATRWSRMPVRLSNAISLTGLQGSCPFTCFLSVVLSARRLPSLLWVPASLVPHAPRYYEGATTSQHEGVVPSRQRPHRLLADEDSATEH